MKKPSSSTIGQSGHESPRSSPMANGTAGLSSQGADGERLGSAVKLLERRLNLGVAVASVLSPKLLRMVEMLSLKARAEFFHAALRGLDHLTSRPNAASHGPTEQ